MFPPGVANTMLASPLRTCTFKHLDLQNSEKIIKRKISAFSLLVFFLFERRNAFRFSSSPVYRLYLLHHALFSPLAGSRMCLSQRYAERLHWASERNVPHFRRSSVLFLAGIAPSKKKGVINFPHLKSFVQISRRRRKSLRTLSLPHRDRPSPIVV